PPGHRLMPAAKLRPVRRRCLRDPRRQGNRALLGHLPDAPRRRALRSSTTQDRQTPPSPHQRRPTRNTARTRRGGPQTSLEKSHPRLSRTTSRRPGVVTPVLWYGVDPHHLVLLVVVVVAAQGHTFVPRRRRRPAPHAVASANYSCVIIRTAVGQ